MQRRCHLNLCTLLCCGTSFQTSLSFPPVHNKQWMCMGEAITVLTMPSEGMGWCSRALSYHLSFLPLVKTEIILCELYSGEQGLILLPHWFKDLMFSSTPRTLPSFYSQMQRNLPESWCKSLRNIVGALWPLIMGAQGRSLYISCLFSLCLR